MWATKNWLEDRIQSLRIRRWFRHLPDGGELQTCRALWRLNRHARSGGIGKNYIYELKGKFIEHLYRKYEVLAYEQWPVVTVQEQKLTCYSCDGTGTYFNYQGVGETCFKCGGSGIYRQHLLYRFEFKVSGHTFVWHQPRSLVHYPVRISMGRKAYESGPRGHHLFLDKDYCRFLMDVLSVYLELHTEHGEQSLWPALVEDWHRSKHRLRRKVLNDVLDICPDCRVPGWWGQHEGCIPF